MRIGYFSPLISRSTDGPIPMWGFEAFSISNSKIESFGVFRNQRWQTKFVTQYYEFFHKLSLNCALLGDLMMFAVNIFACVRNLTHIRKLDKLFVLSPVAIIFLGLCKAIGLIPDTAIIGVQFNTIIASRGVKRFLLDTAFRNLTALIVVSRKQVEEFKNHYPNLDVRYLKTGIDTHFWQADPGHVAGFPDEDYIICAGDAGRDDDLLIEIAKHIKWRVVRVCRWQSTRLKYEKAFSENSRLRDKIVFAYRIDARQLRPLYTCAKALFLPLVDEKEPYGQTVLLEALACGCPVILNQAYTYGGVEEGEKDAVIKVERGLQPALQTLNDMEIPTVNYNILRQYIVQERSLQSKLDRLIEIAAG